MSDQPDVDPFGPKVQAQVPRHGWVANVYVDGPAGHLFPILQVLRSTNEIRATKGAAPLSASERDKNVKIFWETAESAIVVLRELAAIVLDPPAFPPLEEPPDEKTLVEFFEKRMREDQLIPVFVDAAYGQLSRLADLVAAFVWPVLFEGSPPDSVTEFRSKTGAEQLEKLRALSPNSHQIAALFRKNGESMQWFDVLKHSKRGLRDVRVHGFRDTLTYRPPPHVDPKQVPRMYALTRRPEDGGATSEGVPEMISSLSECYRGFCSFLTTLVRQIGATTAYRQGDLITVWGPVEPTVYFWPSIYEADPPQSST